MKKETRDSIRDKLWKVMSALMVVLFVLFVIFELLSCAFATTGDKTLFSLMLKLMCAMIVIAIAEMFCLCAYNLLEYTKQERRKRRKELNALILETNDDSHWKKLQIKYNYLCTRYR